MILKLVLGCVTKFSMGCIKIGHTALLPLWIVKGCVEGSGFMNVLIIINRLNGFNSIISRFSC